MYSCTKQDINAAFKDSVQEKYCFSDMEEFNDEIIIFDKKSFNMDITSGTMCRKSYQGGKY